MVPVSCSPMVLTLSQGVISGIAGKLQSFTPLWVLCMLEEIQVHLDIPVHAESIQYSPQLTGHHLQMDIPGHVLLAGNIRPSVCGL